MRVRGHLSRGVPDLLLCTGRRRDLSRSFQECRRHIRISATPSTTSPDFDTRNSTNIEPNLDGGSSPDARFEVLGAPFSLLSVSLSASQRLYTRRGTLVGVTGKPENAVSTLSILEPFRRAALRIPFLYQQISSTTPLTALISTKSPLTSFAVVHLNGTTDWVIAQPKALLAWTGHTLSIRPTINSKMSFAHWGSSEVRGRGLLALSGQGQIYQMALQEGEEFVAHPSNVVAYDMTRYPPLPYRLKSSSLRLQIPSLDLARFLPDTKFFQVMWSSGTWKALRNFSFAVRTWSRRTIWGDRLFLRFQGPTTILLQSRASRVSDVMSARDVNEVADAPPGVAQAAILEQPRAKQEAVEAEADRISATEGSSPTRKRPAQEVPTTMRYASVHRDGHVSIDSTRG